MFRGWSRNAANKSKMAVAVVSIIWKFEYFTHFAWKCLFTPPQSYGFGGGFDPLNESISTEPPKGTFLHGKTCRSSKSVHRWDLCAWRRHQKIPRNLTVANWIFAQTTHVVQIKILFGTACCFPALVISFKFHQHRLSSYPAMEGSNFGSSHYLGQWLIQQLYSRTAVINELMSLV